MKVYLINGEGEGQFSSYANVFLTLEEAESQIRLEVSSVAELAERPELMDVSDNCYEYNGPDGYSYGEIIEKDI